ncbi:MAG: right-handed parallel beta-helix repeat-containing protein [Aquabacterium sp.]|nr:right-handed parallel beta-helix repeat-containing protein [Aquabacterium sp.]MBT9609519.1 right-handed parallel beta-helix repeat-containing protein [Aquabacterium sp.]
MRDLIRAQAPSMTGNIIVNLAPGNYTLTNTFELGPQDSGSNGYSVIFQGPTTTTTPAVLSGGINVTGWTLHDSNKNIWKAPLPSTTVNFRQLYVNGTRAIRARWPNVTNLDTGAPYMRAVNNTVSNINGSSTLNFVIRAADWPLGNTVAGAEVVWLGHWTNKHARIAGYTANKPEPTQHTINIQSPENTFNSFTFAPQSNTPYFYEHAYALLDAAGEWYLDAKTTPKTLYYIPRSGEAMTGTRAVSVVAPQLGTLVSIAGVNDARAHHIQWRNVSFKHSNWTLPDNVGYGVFQSALFAQTSAQGAAEEVPGAFSVKNASAITLRRNTFSSTGAHGLLLSGLVNNYVVSDNQFSDLSAGGIYDVAYPSEGGLISRNLVEKVGRAYTDGVGILSKWSNNLTVSYNEVRIAPYIGIEQGFFAAAPTDQPYKNNLVIGNHVHHVMQVQDDGGGIYTLGSDLGTKVQDNYVHDITVPGTFVNGDGYPSVCIYIDQGSKGRYVSNNVVSNCYGSFKVNASQNDVGDINIVGNFYNNDLGVSSGLTSAGAITVSGNIFVVPNTAWPAGAQSVINNAGIR